MKTLFLLLFPAILWAQSDPISPTVTELKSSASKTIIINANGKIIADHANYPVWTTEARRFADTTSKILLITDTSTICELYSGFEYEIKLSETKLIRGYETQKLIEDLDGHKIYPYQWQTVYLDEKKKEIQGVVWYSK